VHLLLPEDILQKYYKAGKIASEVRGAARNMVRETMPIIEVCEKVESMIREKGGQPAFPCNICINDVAAHYTSPPSDTNVIPNGSLVKVDLGVHIDGYIVDTATTVCLNPEYAPLFEAAENAINKAFKSIRDGAKASEVGGLIQTTIESYGFKPIWNLNGHKMVRFTLHAGKSIPNVSRLNGTKIEADEVYAIEPFVTYKNANGKVVDSTETFIYRYVKERPQKEEGAKLLLQKIKTEFYTLPFSKRWIYNELPPEEFEGAFNELLYSRALMAYPVLVEESGNIVAQVEHTVIVTENECIVLTI